VGSDDPVGKHCCRNPGEAGEVGTPHVVDAPIGPSSPFRALLVDRSHYVPQPAVNLFTAPGDPQRVLALLEP